MHGSMMGDPAVVLAPCKTKDHFGKLVSFGIKNETNRDKDNPTDPIEIKSGEGYPGFGNWPNHLDIAHQQVHEKWLKNAFKRGLKLIVSCPVNNEMLSLILGALWDKDEWRDMNSLELQVNRIHEFTERNKSWCAIAYNPWHAREIIHSNKLAIVISLEASNIFPADKGEVDAQLGKMYCMGVRMLQIVHEVDNRFAGAAPQERPLVGMQTISRLTKVSLDALTTKKAMDDGLGAYFMDGKDKPLGFDLDRNGENTRGLSDKGIKLIEGMMSRHMLIDTAHYSKRTLQDVFEVVKKHQYYPLCNTHTKFFEVLSDEEIEVQREFLTTGDQVKYYVETGGIIGLRTGPWVNKQVNPKYPAVITDKKGGVGTSRSFAQQLAFAKNKGVNFAFGTDINGFTNQLGPRKKDGKKPDNVTSEYWSKGLRHIAMLADLLTDLKYLHAPGTEILGNSAELFLKTWERAWDPKRKKVSG
jgi:microsomal dipeptidase-like Zn-dependent dipeptidase